MTQFEMFKTLWKSVASEYKLQLIIDFIINPGKIEKMYQAEISFQNNINNHWR